MPYSAFQYLPLAMEASNNEIALAVVGILVTLIGQHFVLRKYIREAAGVKETQMTEVSGQPIHVVTDEKPMTVNEHAAVCGHLGRRVSTLEGDVKEIRRKMELDKNEIIKAVDDKVERLEDKLEAVPGRVVAFLRDTKGLL